MSVVVFAKKYGALWLTEIRRDAEGKIVRAYVQNGAYRWNRSDYPDWEFDREVQVPSPVPGKDYNEVIEWARKQP